MYAELVQQLYIYYAVNITEDCLINQSDFITWLCLMFLMLLNLKINLNENIYISLTHILLLYQFRLKLDYISI